MSVSDQLLAGLELTLTGMVTVFALLAFMVLDFAGRSLNIISLAGLAFATGMVLDAAIVVLENIYRHREEGNNRLEAARKGSREVAMAITASTLTTVAVFVSVLFISGLAGLAGFTMRRKRTLPRM